MSGDFWGSQEGCQGPSRPSGRNRGLPLRRRRGQGPLPLRQTQRSPEGPRHLHRIPRLSEAGTVSPFRAEQGTSLETPSRARVPRLQGTLPNSPSIKQFSGAQDLSLKNANFPPPEGNTEGPGTASSEPLLPSSSRQESRFPCVVWKGFPAFPAHLRMRPASRGNSRRATWVVPHAESQAPRRAVCGTRGSLRTMHGGGSAPSCCVSPWVISTEPAL